MKILRVKLKGRARAIHRFGIGLSAIGLALMFSVVVTLAVHLSDWNTIQVRGRSIAVRAVGGLVLAGSGFCAMAAASHETLSNDKNPVEADDDAVPRRSEQDRHLLRRVGEADAKVYEDPRHWPSFGSAFRAGAPAQHVGDVQHSQAAQTEQRAAAVAPAAVVVVKVRCRTCRKLSAEEASVCEHCGRGL